MSLYDKLGFTGAVSVAVQTTPIYALPALPFTFSQFATVLRKSQDLATFEVEHCDKKRVDLWYRVFRPRGREAIEVLRGYGIH